MADAHANFATSLVATAPSPATSGTSLVVTGGEGTRFPAVPFNATVCPVGSAPTPANAEIVRVTGISTDTFTITRAQESSSARTVVVGDRIYAGPTKKSFTDIEAGTDIGVRIPARTAGLYYPVPIGSPQGGGSFTLNRLIFVPLWIDGTQSFDRIGVNVTTGTASATQRFGIYNDNGAMLPGSLLVDYGTVATTSTAFAQITISQTLTKGIYWVATVAQGVSAPVYRVEVHMMGFGSTSGTDVEYGPYYRSGDNTSGALPDPAGTILNGTAIFAPRVMLRAA